MALLGQLEARRKVGRALRHRMHAPRVEAAAGRGSDQAGRFASALILERAELAESIRIRRALDQQTVSESPPSTRRPAYITNVSSAK